MGNTEKYTYTVDYTSEESGQEKRDLIPSESEFFRQMEKTLKKFALDIDVQNPLKTLYDNFQRLNRLLITLQQPWLDHCEIIQKACAWYIAFARPTKEEARTLIETLNGFTTSTCCVVEWNLLINRAQEFFIAQEKELKRLFDYEKENERKHKERMEHLSKDGTAYCLTFSEEEIYGVLYPQLEQLYEVMGRFIEREKAPFRCKIKGYEDYGVSISKDVDLHADRDEFHVNYSLGTSEYDFDSMPAGQMQKAADIISDFLKVFGENGDRKVRWDIADYPRESQPDIAFEIKEDSRLPLYRSVPWISKRIHKNEGEETEIEYFIDVNDIPSPELSFGEFVAVYRKLGDFLQGRKGG